MAAVKNSILAIVQIFHGLSGLFGGLMLLHDPTGQSLSLELEWLQNTPFPNFLIPGIILFIFVGIGNILGFWFTYKKKRKRAQIGIIFGIILMAWIISQLAWIGYKDFLQPLYFSTGLIQTIFGYALIKSLKEG